MPVQLSFLVFVSSFLVLLWILRRDRVSLGLPIAYFLAFALEHAPGAYARMVSGGFYGNPAVDRGFFLATVGAVSFVLGVALMHTVLPRVTQRRKRSAQRNAAAPKKAAPPTSGPDPLGTANFRVFCLIAGWLLIYGLSAVLRIPSISAVIEKGGAIWMLGVMLGLSAALRRGQPIDALAWMSALAVYPIIMLLFGGFLSYGSAAVIICASILIVRSRSYLKTLATIAICVFLGLSAFVNYFNARDQIRNVVWSGASFDRRVDVVLDVVADFALFDPNDLTHLRALDLRLNQNYFVGVAADRLENRYVEYLNGRSVWEGVLSLVPRAIWPSKPVFGGSGDIVREMTGLNLSQNTSWGVGQVLEFYINYAVQGVIVGFLLLGGLLGWLDRRAALTLRGGNLGKVFLYFLPGVALIQPIGSLVEITGGAGAALTAGFVWQAVWSARNRRQTREAEYARLIGQAR